MPPVGTCLIGSYSLDDFATEPISSTPCGTAPGGLPMQCNGRAVVYENTVCCAACCTKAEPAEPSCAELRRALDDWSSTNAKCTGRAVDTLCGAVPVSPTEHPCGLILPCRDADDARARPTAD